MCWKNFMIWRKMIYVSNLVNKTDNKTKFSQIENDVTTNHDHDKYITT